ncbi:unnamed protein product [Phyllotreta striolata]|uniref:CHK kinase-like domain-containing protein n=1 Tax=Phyllotreta striolata TaxID=444603 RepID=A0A9N9TE95_PHYSR|nr:unnamed protein product [Phyllotreta striolata]
MTAEPVEIANIRDLLADVSAGSRIIGVETTRLTAPGENYGSLMLRLDVRLAGGELRLVAKKLPTEELFQESFNVQVTFKNEIAMYQTVVPLLQKFQRENGVVDVIDCFPKFYGARINLDGSEVVDEHAVLLLENLVANGYKNINRLDGFDLASTELILKDLAEFHAVPLALKLKKPEVFAGLKQYCHDYEFPRGLVSMYFDSTKRIIKENEQCAPLIDKINFLTDVDRSPVVEPFGTLVHCDLWCNNTMQRFDAAGVAVQNKFLDFQFLAYGSPASDLFFFLWTSVRCAVLKEHFERLLRHYHQHFVGTLAKLKCDVGDFGYDAFLEDIKRHCRFEVGHSINFILYVVHNVVTKEEFKFPDDIEKVASSVTPKAKEIVWTMLLECEKRNWLYK